MPIYIYRCPSCGIEVEESRSIEERNDTTYCPDGCEIEGGVRYHRTNGEVREIRERFPVEMRLVIAPVGRPIVPAWH